MLPYSTASYHTKVALRIPLKHISIFISSTVCHAVIYHYGNNLV